MNWKQFLKPDWKKIVITGLFIILFIFLSILPGEPCLLDFQCQIFGFGNCITSNNVCLDNYIEWGINPCYYYKIQNITCPFECKDNYNLPWNLATICGKPNILTSTMIKIYPALLIFAWLITSYFLSCLIVWIYDKFIKKKGDYVHIQNINMIMGQQKRDKKKK